MENYQTNAEPQQQQAQEPQQQFYATVAQEPQPPTYLARSIVSTIIGCIPFGIVAIVKASHVESAWKAGRYEEAKAYSRAARKWSLIAFLVGIAIYVLMTIYMYFMFSVIDELYDNAYYYDYGYYDDYGYDDYGYDDYGYDDLDFDDYGYDY